MGTPPEGGTLIFDDYVWGENRADEVTPRVAIDTFVTLFRQSLNVTWREHQLVVRKRKSPCSVIAELYCSRLGNYAYYWRKKALFDSMTGKKVALTESERAMVERLIKGVQIGESSVSIPSELASDPTLIANRVTRSVTCFRSSSDSNEWTDAFILKSTRHSGVTI